MADIKLTYFNIKGRAELSRLILSYAGAKFTDERLSGPEFATLKTSLRYGQMPKLTYNGEDIYQSMTIARFLAKEFGLGGRTNLEAAQADEIVDVFTDLIEAKVRVMFGKDDEKKKAELLSKLSEDTIPKALAKLEKLLQARGGQFMTGNALTWADITVFCFYDWQEDKDLVNDFPGLKNLILRVAGLPNIAKYLQSRP